MVIRLQSHSAIEPGEKLKVKTCLCQTNIINYFPLLHLFCIKKVFLQEKKMWPPEIAQYSQVVLLDSLLSTAHKPNFTVLQVLISFKVVI